MRSKTFTHGRSRRLSGRNQSEELPARFLNRNRTLLPILFTPEYGAGLILFASSRSALRNIRASGDLVRRIDITRLSRDEKGRTIPATVVVHGPRKNTVTEFNGARIDTDKTFSDADFTPANALH